MPLFRHGHLPRFLSSGTYSDRRPEHRKAPASFLGHLGSVLSDFSPRVLICEEDIPLRMQLRGTFREIGCEVDAPQLSSDVFHEIETEEFDLVLMRYTPALLQADRVEFAPWARISTPFILYDDEARHKEAHELGFEGFSRLPIPREEAQRILTHYVFGDLLHATHNVI